MPTKPKTKRRPDPSKSASGSAVVRKPAPWNPTDIAWLATHPVAVSKHPVWAAGHPVTVRRVKTQRAKNAANANPLYNPLAQLSGYDLQQAASKIAGAQIDPAEKAIDAQIKTAQGIGTEQGRRAESYYTQLAKDVQGGLDAQRAISDRLKTGLSDIASGTATRTAQAGQQAGQALQGDEALRGPVSSSDALQRELAAAIAAQGKDAQAFQSTGVKQAAGVESLGQTTLDTSRLRGGEVQTDIMGRTRQAVTDLGQKRADVESTRGGLVAKALQDLRQNEFEKFATVKGLGIKEADLIQSGQIADAKLKQQRDIANQRDRTQRRGQDVTARGQDISADTQRRGQDAANWRATLKRGKSGNLSATSNNRVTGQINTAWSYLHQYPKSARRALLQKMQAGGGTFKDADGNSVRIPKIDPWAARAAFEMVNTGRMGSGTYHQLRGLGYVPPREWLPRRPRPVPTRGY